MNEDDLKDMLQKYDEDSEIETEKVSSDDDAAFNMMNITPPPQKRKRGRPRKTKVVAKP